SVVDKKLLGLMGPERLYTTEPRRWRHFKTVLWFKIKRLENAAKLDLEFCISSRIRGVVLALACSTLPIN
ncbi:MAG: hypothetical protein ACK5UY_03270, partial [Holosporales bacterium]